MNARHERAAPIAGDGSKRKPPPLAPRPRNERLPLSFAQQRLWFLAQLAPEDVSYNVPYYLRMKGALDVGALQLTIEALAKRHEVLRTTFAEWQGEVVQKIAADCPVVLAIENLESLPATQAASAVEHRAVEEVRRPFDLRKGPLWRATLLRVSNDEHVLLLVMHHIVCDGWSMGVLAHDLQSLYQAYCQGVEPRLPELPVQYADYARWQREWLSDEAMKEQIAWWREQLAGAPAVLDLPTDRPPPAVRTSCGNRYSSPLSVPLWDAVRELSRREGVTPYMTLLAAFYVLMFRYSGQPDVLVGSPIAGRNRRELEGLIGFFVNTLVLRARAPGELSFKELLARVRQACMGAYGHQDVPFEKLVDALQPTRDMARTPLFQVMFVLQNAPSATLRLPGLALEVMDMAQGTAIFDLLLQITVAPDGPIASWDYRTDVFDEATVASMAAHYARTLESAVARPETNVWQLPLLTPAEEQQIVRKRRGAHTDPPGRAGRAGLGVSRIESAPQFESPRTALEEQVANVWAALLGCARVGVRDNFFELGGHSLMATQVASRLRETLSREVPVRMLFEAPTVAELAGRLESLLDVAQATKSLPLTPAPRHGSLPLSFAQQRLWFLERMTPGGFTYNVPTLARLQGQLDIGALERSFAELLGRHEVLRTSFAESGAAAVQIIAPEAALTIAIESLEGLPEASRSSAAFLRARQESRRPFDLAQGPLVRATLYRLAADEWLLLLNLHHIVCDGWSLSVLLRELEVLYTALCRGVQPELPALPVHYVDYSIWQRQWLQGEVLESQLDYWKQQLAGMPAALELPLDRPRPPVQSHAGALLTVRLPEALCGAIQDVDRRQGVTPFMTLLAGYFTFLSRYSGQTDIIVGAPIAGRNRRELEALIGCFVNLLPMRVAVPGDISFRALLGRVREACLGAYAHQDVPFEQVVDAVQSGRDPSRSPIFQVGFVYQEGPAALRLPGLSLQLLDCHPGMAKFDLTLFVRQMPGEWLVDWEYNTDLFEAASIERMSSHWLRLLSAAVGEPERPLAELEMLSTTERNTLLVDWNPTHQPPPEVQHVYQMFERQVARTPHAVATVWGDLQLTYGELELRAGHVARRLRALGARPDARFAVCTPDPLDAIVAILGILKAGAAYVALDATNPAERLAYLVGDLKPVAVLGAPREGLEDVRVLSIAELAAGKVATDLAGEHDVPVPLDALACIIYTSGSTGKPKGAMITHRALTQRIEHARGYFALGKGDTVLQSASLGFDASVLEILLALTSGARLALIAPTDRADPERLLHVLAARQVSFCIIVPTMLGVLLDAGLERASSLKCVVSAGEALSSHLRDRFLARLPDVQLVNGYGPTECTIYVSLHRCTAGEVGQPVVLGRPVDYTQGYVLDSRLQPVPIGVTGELWFGGEVLARGYLDRPELTAERFVLDPFSTRPGARMYRTGDLGRWRASGELEYLGRVDHQVKLRGLRIELGEIEAELGAHRGVSACAVALVSVGDAPRLVAYVVPREHRRVDAAMLREFLQETLPEYMIPATFVLLQALPLNASGKIDRKALPALEARADVEQSYVAPRTAMEEVIAGIWGPLLGCSRVAAHDNFFELGGHSLLAAQVASRLCETLHREVPVRMLFEVPVLANLAQRLDLMLAGDTVPPPPLLPASRAARLPLSFAQQRLWFLEQFDPGGFAYNVPYALRIGGPLDVAALERSLAELVRRHEALRTTFAEVDGEPVQRIAPARSFVIPVHTLAASAQDRLAPASAAGALESSVEEQARLAFDLEQGPLIRATLWRLAPEEHVLLVVMHHIVCDVWSLSVLTRELAALYAAFSTQTEPSLPSLPIQYADYAAWQRKWLTGEALQTQLDWWKQRLSGAPPMLELPLDRPRPKLQTFRGSYLTAPLPASLTAALRELGREAGVTTFMTYLAGFMALLARYTGQTDVVVGSPILGRHRKELEGLIGCFLNTLVLRVEVPEDASFRELLGRVREVCLGAYAHQDLPFEQLVESLQPVRDMSRSPLFQVMFAHQAALPSLELPGLDVDTFAFDPGMAKFDLTLFVRETADGPVSIWEYNTDLFDATTVARMAACYARLLQAAVARGEQKLSQLSLLSDQERRQVLMDWNATAVMYPPMRSVQALFEASTKRDPGAVAVSFGNEQLTYGELNQKSNRLAHHLRARGVTADVAVGLCARRSLDLPVGVLGILKAGGAYVPLDPEYPRDRLAMMMEASGAQVLVTQSSLRDALPAHRDAFVLLDANDSDWTQANTATAQPIAGPDNLAYVIYTSGSTGMPKGVAMHHRPLLNLIRWQVEQSRQPRARTLQFSAISFDASFQEMFSTWAAGGELVLVSEAVRRDASALLQLLERERIERLFLPFVALQQLAEASDVAPRIPRHMKEIITAGEQLRMTPALRRFMKRLGGCVLHNHYGPTETHVATAFALHGDPERWPDLPPIGRPIANTSIHLLDRHLEPVPIGVPGELYIGGAAVAREYLHQPQLTQERFLRDPIEAAAGGRLYRTGDFARYLPDGSIEFLGRRDAQVKVRGYRVELAEVESALAQHADVADCVVSAHADASEQKRLVAYVVGRQGSAPQATELRDFLKARLPEYMVPATFVHLDAFPLTPSGKVARGALPVPDGARAEHAAIVGPRNALELQLVQLWEEVLGIHPIGVRDNFFELGGHSLLALRLTARIRGSLGRTLPVATLFQHATIESLAHVLHRDAGPWSPLVELRGKTATRPFFCVHAVGGTVMSYGELARLLGPEQSFYGLQSRGIEDEQTPLDSIEAMAESYVQAVRTVQPRGPYRLGGWSMGGCVAYEMAQQLQRAGEQVEIVVLIDSFARLFSAEQSGPDAQHEARLAALFYQDVLRAAGQDSELSQNAFADMQPREMLAAVEKAGLAAASALGIGREPLQAQHRVFKANLRAALSYTPRAYAGSVVCFEATASSADRGWQQLVAAGLVTHRIDADHYSILRRPAVQTMAAQLRVHLNRSSSPDSAGGDECTSSVA